MSALNVVVRQATNGDLPAIWQLILDSFLAIVDSTHEVFRPLYEKAGMDLREQDLKDVEASYIKKPDTNFWVAESDGTVVGCVALKRINADEGELVRMAVSPALRGGGVGKALVDTLLAHAHELGFARLVLTTINKRAANFYKKMGFVSFREKPMTMPPAENVVLFSMVYYLADKLIRNVAILGGTHGNERLGVTLARDWLKDPTPVQRPSFKTTVLIANEAATARNVRYVDVDLNRCFTLGQPPAEHTAEGKRAQELLSILGPKTEDGKGTACDFIIDMHSTTANMGLSLVMNAEHDAFARRVAHNIAGKFAGLKLTGSPGSKAATWSVDSISPSSIAIEVGPLAHGTLDYTLLDQSRALVHAALDYIEQHNTALLALAAQGAALRQHGGHDYVVSPAVAPSQPFPMQPFYQRAAAIDYPRNSDGEVSGLVHPRLQGQDWAVVAGEVFVDLSGKPLPYTPPHIAVRGPPSSTPPPQPTLYGIFINEAAYYEKGIAMALCELVDLPVY